MNIEERYGDILANSTRNSIKSTNKALSDNLSLMNTLLEVSEVSNAPLTLDQPLIEQCSTMIADTVAARRNVTRFVDKITRAKNASNLEARTFGCPRGKDENITKADHSKEAIIG